MNSLNYFITTKNYVCSSKIVVLKNLLEEVFIDYLPESLLHSSKFFFMKSTTC